MQEVKADRDQELCSRMNTLLTGLVEGKRCWCCFALLQLTLEWQTALAWSARCAIKASLLRLLLDCSLVHRFTAVNFACLKCLGV